MLKQKLWMISKKIVQLYSPKVKWLHNQEILNLEQIIAQKEHEIAELKAKLESATHFLQHNQLESAATSE